MSEQNYDVIIVGAGFGGIGAAVQLKRLGFENFVLLDRLDDLGGTWYVNHYPGLAVDVPTTTYSYFFEPNPDWSRMFTPGPEIKKYAVDVANKYDVRRHMRFNVSVVVEENGRRETGSFGTGGRFAYSRVIGDGGWQRGVAEALRQRAAHRKRRINLLTTRDPPWQNFRWTA